MTKKDLSQRRNNYKRLKEAGFNSYEATKFKDLKESKIVALIEEMTSSKSIIDNIRYGKTV